MAGLSKRILVTRAPNQASALADQLRAAGFEPILIPTIEIVDPSTFALLDASLAHLHSFHWLLFTSANAVEAFQRRLTAREESPRGTDQAPQGFSLGCDRRAVQGALARGTVLGESLRIAAIGPATARALAALGREADLIPAQAVAESLAQALLSHTLQPDGTPTRFLLVRAETARDHLPETLRTAGADVTIAPAYRTITPAGSIPQIRELFSDPASYPAAITFTSSSTARNLFNILEAAGLTLPSTILRASIGPITSGTLRDLGSPAHAEAPIATMLALVDTLAKLLA